MQKEEEVKNKIFINLNLYNKEGKQVVNLSN